MTGQSWDSWPVMGHSLVGPAFKALNTVWLSFMKGCDGKGSNIIMTIYCNTFWKASARDPDKQHFGFRLTNFTLKERSILMIEEPEFGID